MKTLSEIAATLISVEVPCEDCDGTGHQEFIETNVRDFFNPYRFVNRICKTCQGDKLVLKDVCPLCRQVEDICNRACRRTPCCKQHPMNCDCRQGVTLYSRTYGLSIAA